MMKRAIILGNIIFDVAILSSKHTNLQAICSSNCWEQGFLLHGQNYFFSAAAFIESKLSGPFCPSQQNTGSLSCFHSIKSR